MSTEYSIDGEGLQASPVVARALSQQLTAFVQPLLIWLDALVDLRLVQTFLATLHVLVEFRHRNNGLLLSELGAYLASPAHAPAGTKRLSNLLHSAKWASQLIEDFVKQRAEARLAELEQAGADGLLLWDESVIEKAESIAVEGLCAVRSSKARRLKRIKPGYYNPPAGLPSVCWACDFIALLLLGRPGPPTLATMKWWTTRGALATSAREQEVVVLDDRQQRWGRRVIHVFDQGFAGSRLPGAMFPAAVALHLALAQRLPSA